MYNNYQKNVAKVCASQKGKQRYVAVITEHTKLMR